MKMPKIVIASAILVVAVTGVLTRGHNNFHSVAGQPTSTQSQSVIGVNPVDPDSPDPVTSTNANADTSATPVVSPTVPSDPITGPAASPTVDLISTDRCRVNTQVGPNSYNVQDYLINTYSDGSTQVSEANTILGSSAAQAPAICPNNTVPVSQ